MIADKMVKLPSPTTAVERITEHFGRTYTPNMPTTIGGQISLVESVQEVLAEIIVEAHKEGHERTAVQLRYCRDGLQKVVGTLKASQQLVEALEQIKP
jgi:hypothetical protein